MVAAALHLTLAPLQVGHLAELRTILAEPALALPYFGQVLTDAQIGAHLAAYWSDSREVQTCVATDTTSNRVVGAAGVRGAELSYFVAPAFWRRGAGAALVHALSGKRPLFVHVSRDNAASIALLVKTGFRFDGRLPSVRPASGGAMLRYVLR